MKNRIAALLALVVAVGVLFETRRPESSAVKVCRADAQTFTEEIDSYTSEYDTLYGATTIAQRPLRELFDRDEELAHCIGTDPGNRKRYRTLLDRNGFIESARFVAYLNDTKSFPDFADWERGQQAAQLEARAAKYDSEK
jgi:hypothetical protein